MTESRLDVPKLAASYRRLVLWFGAQLLITLVGPFASRAVGDNVLGLGIALGRLAGILVTIVALVLYAYRTAAALGSRVSLLWGVAMLIPLVNLITLLLLSSRATTACRAAGIEVGFLGPKIGDTGTSRE